MRCLCCGKSIKETATTMEKTNLWHEKCIKKFFGTKEFPYIDISDEQLEELANEVVNQGLTVPGIQKKLSLHLSKESDLRMTIVDYPTGYILKPQTEEYPCLPEFEDLAMRMADLVGIQTVPHALVMIKERFAYITKRVDRDITDGGVKMYAMEDFCQLSNRLTQDKYKGSYENCGRIIKKYSVHQGLDMSELFLRIVFSYVIGNSDMHLKNFSLKETEPGKRSFVLSKAYDLLPVSIVVPEDEEELALTLNGKKRNLTRKDFIVFAENCGITKKTAEALIAKICSHTDSLLGMCDDSYLPEKYKTELRHLIISRVDNISKKS